MRRRGLVADGILLLHGIARTSASMRALQRALEASGYEVLNLNYRSRHLPLDALAESIHPAVSRFAAATPSTWWRIRWAGCWPGSTSRATVRIGSGGW